MIRAFIETSLIDWDGKITSVFFFDRCNFRCPYCQNWRLITHPEKFPVYEIEELFKIVLKKKNWIDGIVLTGGEPLLFPEAIMTIAEIAHKNNLKIKLDTNGSLPEELGRMLELKIVDYVAMDIKAPLDTRYFLAVGKKPQSQPDLIDKIKKSINLLLNSDIDYEFRTTCVPGLIDEKGLRQIGAEIKGARLWALQRYIALNAYKKEYRNKQFDETQLQKFLEIARSIMLNVKLR
ncbi:MAG: anaerobic ribonucleoside-triphosphate reductase activating protein [candidate division WOR-3 bacterium]